MEKRGGEMGELEEGERGEEGRVVTMEIVS